MNGKVFGVGVGPGDSELLTVKAVNAIKGADVIIAPRTEKKEGSVALDIARCYIGENTEIVYQIYPMVKGFSEDTSAWEKNKAEIMAMLEQGKQVVFLTLGDPMFYSTYIYVYNRLKEAGANIETIPGIPAFMAGKLLLIFFCLQPLYFNRPGHNRHPRLDLLHLAYCHFLCPDC